MLDATYDTIGKTYDTTRKADPTIAKRIFELLHPGAGNQYLDIGCGSGNYTGDLFSRGANISGIDISEVMLTKAREKFPEIKFYQGNAQNLPFENESYAGATCILATHHFENSPKAFHESYRVIKNGRFVIFTSTPQQMQQYWLCHYFPKMMQDAMQKMASFEEIKFSLENAGFSNIRQTPFYVCNQLQDWFLQSGKYRPQVYLDPIVREGISSFHLSTNKDELKIGLQALEADINNGKINNIIDQYESPVGDYMFIIADKIIILG